MTRVSVFESDSPEEIKLLKAKLESAWIDAETGATTPDLLSNDEDILLTLAVNLQDEQQAFKIIDTWLQENDKHDKPQ
ncbi:MAG: DUF2007 domain-containing protein [Weeksellaceae bacterium]|nr:DUF2007 domain-containing protein [Weeksellaceae bacterium]